MAEGDAQIGLGEGRRIVGAVAAHAYPPTMLLLAAQNVQFVLRGRLSHELVDSASAATVAAVNRLSPVTITVRTPMRRNSSHCARMPGRMTS